MEIVDSWCRQCCNICDYCTGNFNDKCTKYSCCWKICLVFSLLKRNIQFLIWSRFVPCSVEHAREKSQHAHFYFRHDICGNCGEFPRLIHLMCSKFNLGWNVECVMRLSSFHAQWKAPVKMAAILCRLQICPPMYITTIELFVWNLALILASGTCCQLHWSVVNLCRSLQ